MTDGTGRGPLLRVLKGHGTRNDFVLLPDADGLVDLTSDLVRALCDRRSGVGGDGVLRVVRTAALPDPPVVTAAGSAPPEWFMDYRNADGSVAEMCGNGVRVFARFLVEEGLAPPGRLAVGTRDGVKQVDVPATGDVSVEMGRVSVSDDPLEVAVDGRSWPAVGASVGNPHAVALVDDLAGLGPLTAPPVVSPAGSFPDGVNVEFAVVARPGVVALRVYERGVGETQSCGTGVCAVVAVAARTAPAAEWQVDVPGGRLRATLTLDGDVTLTGPALVVWDGLVRRDALGG